MFLVEEKDSKDTPKFSEIKIGEADYLVFDQTR
jgi:predicted transcriptional regulator YdeE